MRGTRGLCRATNNFYSRLLSAFCQVILHDSWVLQTSALSSHVNGQGSFVFIWTMRNTLYYVTMYECGRSLYHHFETILNFVFNAADTHMIIRITSIVFADIVVVWLSIKKFVHDKNENRGRAVYCCAICLKSIDRQQALSLHSHSIACRHRHAIIAQRVQVIGPGLHHLPALIEVLGEVIGSSDLVPVAVC